MQNKARWLVAVISMLIACKKNEAPPTTLQVAAAADLAGAFKEVGAAFQKKTGTPVVFSFGSTGLLAKQIAEGAPFDVFAAANMSYADDAIQSGACFADTKSLYATGRIVMWTTTRDSLPTKIEDLSNPKYAKIAIANPEHAPYGQAAKQALTKAGVWSTISPRIVYAENVQQTLQLAQSGNADVAIVALSLAIGSDGAFTPIDSALHDRIDQALVVCKGQSPASAPTDVAKSFTAFVGSTEGRAIMKRYGFLLSSETP
jgi:molybdate transport system substrate-binding protein